MVRSTTVTVDGNGCNGHATVSNELARRSALRARQHGRRWRCDGYDDHDGNGDNGVHGCDGCDGRYDYGRGDGYGGYGATANYGVDIMVTVGINVTVDVWNGAMDG